MTKYPRGRDIAVNWTLDLGGMSVDLAECSITFEYHTGLGSKIIPGTQYSIDGNVLSWTFAGEDQVVYGVYGLRLVASTGVEDIVFRLEDAFEIVHGIAGDEEQTLPLESSVETDQEPAPEPEPADEGEPVYVSSSPIHVEKVPLGSNITVLWKLITVGDFDFDLEECSLGLYYAAAGSGFKMAADYELDTTDGYVLVWRFAADEQIRYGLYSLLLDVRKDGAKVATLVKDDAFALVHRRGSVFPDRIIDFESVVTTMGGGALYSLLDVINDGYSTVFRADGITPAERDDLLIYNGSKWYAINEGDLSSIRGLKNDFSSLELTTEGIFGRVTDLENNVGELWLTSQEFGVRMSDAEGYIGELTLTARQFEVRMSDAEGNIGDLTLTSQQFAVRMSNAEGNIGQLTLTAEQFAVRMSDAEGNIGQLALTAEEFGVRMTNAEGSIGELSLTAEEFGVRMTDAEGNIGSLELTARSLTSRISNAEGDISILEQTATSLTSRISNAEGSISTIAQTAESIQLQVDSQQGDIATLEVTSRAITSRVANAEGDISILEQTATSLTSRISNAEGDISTLEQTATSLTSRISNAEGDISVLEQTATSLTSRISNAEGDISTLEQTATSLTSRISSAEGDISTLEQTATSLTSRISSAEGDISTLEQTATSLTSRITNAEGDISTISQDVSSIELRVETAEGSISSLTTDVSGIHAEVQSVSSDLGDYEDFVNGVLDGIQDQIDGAIDTWFYDYMPVHTDATGAPDSQVPLVTTTVDGHTVSCLPYYDWYTADGGGTAAEVDTERLKHLGDIFYDNKSGYAFRFSNTGTSASPVFAWVEITDSAVIKALADAAKAQDTADHKRRVFVYSVQHPTPYAPYDEGDLWVRPIQLTVPSSSDPSQTEVVSTTVLYRCNTARAAGSIPDFLESEWEPADEKAIVLDRANLQVLSNAIIGQVTQITFGSDGIITNGSTIEQTATSIKLQVANTAINTGLASGGSINNALLPTGIDITQGNITLIADHILLKNQSNITGLELVTIGTGANQRVVIDVSSLNVNGIFTTSAWSSQEQLLQGYADAAAGDAYTDAVSQAATDAASYITTNVVPLITAAQNTADAAQTSVNGMGYLANALLNGTTAIGGGLILSSLVGLGGNSGTGGAWELWSGMNGQYSSSAPGYGIGAWFGGDDVDCITIPNWSTMTSAQRLAAWDTYRYARSLFRLDGSGYLASGAITWGASGDLHLMDNIYIGAGTSNPFTEYLTFLTKLATWFEDVEETIGGVSRRVLRINMNGTAAGGTDFAGLEFNGFLITGGDQIVIDGTPGGGGGGGGSSYLRDLLDVYGHENEAVRRDPAYWASPSVPENAQPGDLLMLKTYTGGNQWAAVPPTAVGITTDATQSVHGLMSAADKTKLDLIAFGTAGSDYVPISIGNVTKNVLTAHQSVTLASGTNNGTLKLIVNGTASADIAVKGLGTMAYESSANYVSAVTYSSEQLHVTKNGTTTDTTIAYATTTKRLKRYAGSSASGGYDLNTMLAGGGTTSQYNSTSYWANAPANMSYGGVAQINPNTTESLVMQLAWDIKNGSQETGKLWWRDKGYNSDTSTYWWGSWHLIYDDTSLTKSVITGLLDAGSGTYLPLSAGSSYPLTGHLFLTEGLGLQAVGGIGLLVYHPSASWSGIDSTQWGVGATNSQGVIRSSAADLIHYKSSTAYAIWDASNSNLSTVSWSANNLSAAGTLTVSGAATFNSTIRVGGSSGALFTYHAQSGNTPAYLELNCALVTAGDQIVISGTPGGGGGGGGSTTLASLLDVAASFNPSPGKFLVYDSQATNNDGGTGAWKAADGVLSVAGLTGAVTTAQIATALTNAGYKLTDTVYTHPTGGANTTIVAANGKVLSAITVNELGHVTSVASKTLAAADIPSITKSKISDFPTTWALANITGADDLKAIEALVGTSGLLRKTAADEWELDTNAYITGNQTITLSGDVSGSGTTSISVTIGNGKVTNAMLAGSIANSKLTNSSITINGSATSLGGSFTTASITAGTAGTSSATSGLSFSVPYVTLNKYGVATGYGTHTHTISASDLTTAIGNTTYAPYHADGYLPLSGGTMTGDITMTNGEFINAASGYAMLGMGSGGTTFYCGPGYEVSNTFLIRSANINLTHRKFTTSSASADYTIWDASNSNLSTIDWTVNKLYVGTGGSTGDSYVASDASNNIYLRNSSGAVLVAVGKVVRRGSTLSDVTLGSTTYPWGGVFTTDLSASGNITVAGTSTFKDSIYIDNRKYIYWANADSSANLNILGVNNSNQLLIGYGMRESNQTALYGNPIKLNVNGNNIGSVDASGLELAVTGGATFIVEGTAANTAAGSIIFRGRSTSHSGFKIASEYVSGALSDRQRLRFYVSQSDGGTAISWEQALELNRYGNVTIGTSSNNKSFTVNGDITSTGDQTVSSDALLKMNWRPLRYGVKEIAKATAGVFDWIDGHGSSAGTKAQDWVGLVPELVHGKEGCMSLAYGQLALVNTVLIARHETEQDKEIRALKERVAELEQEVKRLRS